VIDIPSSLRYSAVVQKDSAISNRRREDRGQLALASGALLPSLGGLGIVGHELDDAGEPAELGLDPCCASCVKVLITSLAGCSGNARINDARR